MVQQYGDWCNAGWDKVSLLQHEEKAYASLDTDPGCIPARRVFWLPHRANKPGPRLCTPGARPHSRMAQVATFFSFPSRAGVYPLSLYWVPGTLARCRSMPVLLILLCCALFPLQFVPPSRPLPDQVTRLRPETTTTPFASPARCSTFPHVRELRKPPNLPPYPPSLPGLINSSCSSPLLLPFHFCNNISSFFDLPIQFSINSNQCPFILHTWAFILSPLVKYITSHQNKCQPIDVDPSRSSSSSSTTTIFGY